MIPNYLKSIKCITHTSDEHTGRPLGDESLITSGDRLAVETVDVVPPDNRASICSIASSKWTAFWWNEHEQTFIILQKFILYILA